MSKGQTMPTMALAEWHAEAVRRFGPDKQSWAFQCPACGHIATVMDHIAAGGSGEWAPQKCIGRVTGKGANGMAGKDEGYGCNWAAYGLFRTLGKGVAVRTPEGDEVEVFAFAPASEVSHGQR